MRSGQSKDQRTLDLRPKIKPKTDRRPETTPSPEHDPHVVLGAVVEDRDILPGAIHAVDLQPLHSAVHAVRILDDDAVPA